MSIVELTLPRKSARAIGGWPLVGWCALGLSLMVAVIVLAAGTGEEGWRMAIRATAKTSVALFLSAFVASPLQRLWPTGVTRWMLRNRRYLGVSFAVSHLLHLVAIVSLAYLSPSFRGEIANGSLPVLALTYLFIAAMAATSFDRTAAWIGPRRWKVLHTVGIYFIWLVFALAYVPRAIASIAYAPLALAVVAALALRLLAPTRHTATGS